VKGLLTDGEKSVNAPYPTRRQIEYDVQIENEGNFIALPAQPDAAAGQDPDGDFSRRHALNQQTTAFDDDGPPEWKDAALRMACIWYIYDAQKL
jgi:hypothetical protein